MCVRTKNSYGCGCAYKSTSECHSSRCTGIERYHCMRDGDCNKCKQGGDGNTRGRDGKGRYAQEISRRSPPVDIPSATGPRLDVSGSASPWASSARRGDEWHSPIRVKVDDAWQKEHDRRMEDLESRTGSMTISAPISPTRPHRNRSPSPSPVPEIEEVSEHYYSQDEGRERRTKAVVPRTLFAEMKGIRDSPSHSRRGPSVSGAGVRYDSNESLDSMPKPRLAPRSHSFEVRDPYDSAYGSFDSYGTRSSHRRPQGARTEPYLYSKPPQRPVYGIPVPAAPYGYPTGSYGVEVHPSARYLSRY